MRPIVFGYSSLLYETRRRRRGKSQYKKRRGYPALQFHYPTLQA
jgi:hypothetical protein